MSTVAVRGRVPLRAEPLRERPATGAGHARLEPVPVRTARVARHRLVPLLAAATVSASLFAVVIGHAALDQDQVRLAAVQSAISSAQVTKQREMVSVADLENPARVLRVAERSLHMATPSAVRQIPYVPLDVPLPTPQVSPASSHSQAPSAPSAPETGNGG